MTFTFDGHSSYKTFIGGFLSTIIHLAILVISILSIITIINIKNSFTSINKIAKNVTNDPEKQYFAKNNDFYFAYKLTGQNREKLKPQFFKVLKKTSFLDLQALFPRNEALIQ